MSAVDRVAAALRAAGVQPQVREFPAGTSTARDAAAAVGCAVGQICKSLVFRAGDEPLLVIASGANRVDERRLGVAKADAEFVRAHTGSAIGGVPPFGHPRAAADGRRRGPAGLPRRMGWGTSVFAIAPATLVALTGARVARVRPGG